MKRLFIASMLCVGISASAAETPCSIQLPKGTRETALAGLAKVTQAAAQQTALAGFTDPAAAATVAESELEVEHGCLIYSFDVRVAGQTGIEEVNVDAGTGAVLSRKHETPKHEAAEAKQEAAEAAAKAKTSEPASSQ